MAITSGSTCTTTLTGPICATSGSTVTVTFSTAQAVATFSVTVNTLRNPQSQYVSSAFSFTTIYVESSTVSWSIDQDTTSITVLPN